jgi:hypothetical protein
MRPDGLAALCIVKIVKSIGLDPNRIEDVIMGYSKQAGW